MKVVGLGNSNNLTWMTLYSLADRISAKYSLYIIKKEKLRDKPPLERPDLIISWVQDFLFSSLKEISLGDEIISDLREADLVLVSGEFIAHAVEIRDYIPQHTKIIAIPIGFDLETLILSFRNSDNPLHQFVSRKMFSGLCGCDFTHCLDNSSPDTVRVVKEAGLAGKTPEVWRHLHVLRLSLTMRLLNDMRCPPVDDGTLQTIRRSIFVASRLCPDVNGSVANKGSPDLFNWIAANFDTLAAKNIGLVFINRDSYSNEYIRVLRQRCSYSGLIRSFGELTYPQFIFVLRNALLAIDSFSVSDSLRPHMTTSDALALGTPTVTSLGGTQIAETIRRDPRLRCSLDPLELLSTTLADSRRAEIEEGFLKSHHEYLYSSYPLLTDKAEADFLIASMTD